MDYRQALSALRAATSLGAALEAHTAMCAADPEMVDFADGLLARKRSTFESQAADDAARASLIAHQRTLLASLEAEVAPTQATRIKANVLRAEIALHEAEQVAISAGRGEDTAAMLASDSALKVAIGNLNVAKWWRRDYRLTHGCKAGLGAMTTEDHLMVNPWTGRRA